MKIQIRPHRTGVAIFDETGKRLCIASQLVLEAGWHFERFGSDPTSPSSSSKRRRHRAWWFAFNGIGRGGIAGQLPNPLIIEIPDWIAELLAMKKGKGKAKTHHG